MSSCEKEILSIARTMEKMLAGRKKMSEALELIRELEKLPITPEILTSTQIDTIVDELRRKATDDKLARRARTLVREWEEMPAAAARRARRNQDRSYVDRKPNREDLEARRRSAGRASNDRCVTDWRREFKRELRDGSDNRPVRRRDDHKPGKPPTNQDEAEKEEEERELPNFEPSGKLTAETNTFKGVVVKYNEPPEAKIAKTRWRMYPFKGTEQLPIIYVHRQSAYLIGRERKVADFPVDHPSCSKQHAVLQYRSMPYQRPDGSSARRTLPYIIDLASANGTYLNGERIEPQRYYELKEQDVLKFGFSSREYVLLKELQEGGAAAANNDDWDPDEDDVDIFDRTGLEDQEENVYEN